MQTGSAYVTRRESKQRIYLKQESRRQKTTLQSGSVQRKSQREGPGELNQLTSILRKALDLLHSRRFDASQQDKRWRGCNNSPAALSGLGMVAVNQVAQHTLLMGTGLTGVLVTAPFHFVEFLFVVDCHRCLLRPVPETRGFGSQQRKMLPAEAEQVLLF